jgi:hypothetical protein
MRKGKSLLVVVSFLSILFLASCGDDPGNTDINIDFYMSVKNAEGKNLLDTATVGHYVKDSIRLYLFKNGEMKELYRPNYDAQRNFLLFQNSAGEFGMKVFPEEGEGRQSQTTTILIQWDKNDSNNIDTVETYIDKKYTDNSESIYVTKITYNGEIKWDIETYPFYLQWGDLFYKRFFEVVK